MHLSNEFMIVTLLIGVAVIYLAGRVIRGSGFGVVGDAAIGIVGALLGNWLLHRFGVHFVGGITGLVVDSAKTRTVEEIVRELIMRREVKGDGL